MSHWISGLFTACQQGWLCVYSWSGSDATHQYLKNALHRVQISQSVRRARLQHVSQPITNLVGVIRKAHHSHMQGTKWIKSTIDIRRIKVYVSPLSCLLIAPSVLPVMASLCYAGSSHTLMNAAICMHKQLLRVYQSKLLYQEWTRPQQWLGL